MQERFALPQDWKARRGAAVSGSDYPEKEVDQTGTSRPNGWTHGEEEDVGEVVQTILVARTAPGRQEIHTGGCRVPESCTNENE